MNDPTDHDSDETVAYRGIEGFPHHRVGDDGSVWIKKYRKISPRWVRMRSHSDSQSDHQRIGLYRDGKTHNRLVHRLVLEAFVGPCPQGMEACHFPDRDPKNNRLSNLRWDTRKANRSDSRIHGTLACGSRNGNAKLKESDIPEIYRLLSEGYSYRVVGKKFGVSRTVILYVVNGSKWKHVTDGRIYQPMPNKHDGDTDSGEVGSRVGIMMFKGSVQFRDWLARFSEKERVPATKLVEEGLARCAIARGFEMPPKRRQKIGMRDYREAPDAF